MGAVVVLDGRVAGAGFNQPIGRADPTAHAEIVALRVAAREVGNYRLTGATLYVTVEPLRDVCRRESCTPGSARWCMERPSPKRERSGPRCARSIIPALNHRVEVIEGVLDEECGQIMQDFFRDKRASSGISTQRS